MAFVVAIDGPAGSGKGTITKIVSNNMKLVNVDTGAMYRCVALKCLENNIKVEDLNMVKHIVDSIDINMKKDGENQIIYLDGRDVSKDIRTLEIDAVVAKYAAIECVRTKMVYLQRILGENEDIVMEGRDIGTVVFPNANVKIYLDASCEERARRRYKQNIEKGIKCNYEEILESIIERHKLETQREISPLVQAEDAIYIDSSNLKIEEVVEKICEIIIEKRKQEV